MATATTKKEIISIRRGEYLRLKKLEARFADFLDYIEHLVDIRDARKEVKRKKLIAQETLFRRLGL